MCSHYPEAQVSVRTVCCRKFFDCPACHEASEDHALKKTVDMALICKKCRKAFRKDLRDFDPETDSYCPHCDNHFVFTSAQPAAVAPSAAMQNLDARMIRDNDVDDELMGFAPDLSKKLG